MIAGYDGPDEGNKATLVQDAIARSDDTMARSVVEELIGLLRQSEYFENGDPAVVESLRRAISDSGHVLDAEGYIRWGFELADGGPTTEAPELHETVGARPTLNASDESRISPGTVEVSSPDLSLLISSLRRLGMGGARSVIKRRHPKGRAALEMDDEYDIQDVVEVLLRSLYGDVRNEEWTPSSAGSSSRIDTFLREGRTAVEVKVTRPGRAEAQIKKEVLVDVHDYQTHPGVDTLVVAVYDLAASFTNPQGFEHDLSGSHGSVTVHVVVVPWVGPLRPAGS